MSIIQARIVPFSRPDEIKAEQSSSMITDEKISLAQPPSEVDDLGEGLFAWAVRNVSGLWWVDGDQAVTRRIPGEMPRRREEV
jgi:hypothetical protein